LPELTEETALPAMITSASLGPTRIVKACLRSQNTEEVAQYVHGIEAVSADHRAPRFMKEIYIAPKFMADVLIMLLVATWKAV